VAVSPGTRALSSLLAALIIIIRAQATKALGPIVLLRIIIIYLFNLPGLFGGLNVLKNS